MITEYHRPDTLQEALALLARSQPPTVPLGGGTVLNAPSDTAVAVVDLQNLGLNAIERQGSTLRIGATATLQALLTTPDLPAALTQAIESEATYNLRQVGTLAGTLMVADGRSPLAAVLLALDTQLTLLPDEQTVNLGEFLPLRAERPTGQLITGFSLSLQPTLAYQYVARTPADRPIVIAAAARWGSGRLRVVLGGYGTSPLMVLDGKGTGETADTEGAVAAAENATLHAGDQWASAEYRVDVAKTLVARCVAEVSSSA